MKGLRVMVEDLETGEKDEKVIPPGEYILTTVEPCHLASSVAYANGTHVLTIKGRTA